MSIPKNEAVAPEQVMGSCEGFELHRPRSGEILLVARASGVTERASLERIASLDANNAACWRDHGYGVWLLVDPSSRLKLGWCGLRAGDTPEDPELMYTLTPPARGKGYATRAARAAVERAFANPAIRSVWACTDINHVASVAVMERAGMAFERQGEVYGVMRLIYRIRRPPREP